MSLNSEDVRPNTTIQSSNTPRERSQAKADTKYPRKIIPLSKRRYQELMREQSVVRESNHSHQVPSIESRYLRPSLQMFNDDLLTNSSVAAPLTTGPKKRKEFGLADEVGGYLRVIVNQCTGVRRGETPMRKAPLHGFERQRYRIYEKKWLSPFA